MLARLGTRAKFRPAAEQDGGRVGIEGLARKSAQSVHSFSVERLESIIMHLANPIRTFKNAAKAGIRQSLRWRLKWLPLTLGQAERWADAFKRWPAIFGSLNYARRRCVAHGILMDLGIVDAVERHLLTKGWWDAGVEAVLKNYLSAGDVFVDVGANIGYFSLIASRLVGDAGVVVAMEPSARALRKLTHHLTINGCSNVVPLSIAAGETSGLTRLWLAPESNIGASAIGRDTVSCDRSETVAIVRIDDVIAQLKVRPSLIKIDIEGYEFHALRGASQLLQEVRPVVVSELSDRFLNDHGLGPADVMHFMEDCGYRCFKLEDTSRGLCCRPCSAKNGCVPAGQYEALFTCGEPRFEVVS